VIVVDRHTPFFVMILLIKFVVSAPPATLFLIAFRHRVDNCLLIPTFYPGYTRAMA
jgi:hypothetical protein